MAAVLPGAELVEDSSLSRHLTFPRNPMFKGVWGTRLADADVDRAIADTIEWFRARNAPFMFWWVGPSTQPRDLGQRLMQHGLISMEEQQKVIAHGIAQTSAGAPIMVAELESLNESALEQTPSGFAIEEVANDQALDDFKRVFVESYCIPEWAGQAWVDATRRAGTGRTPWKMYVGRLDGAPVATSFLFNGGGVASVYAVATLSSARGKGVGGAITLRPLLEARAEGYRYGVLFSTEMGIHAYERIGFRMTEGRIDRYLWRNE
jgi:GNAT superfamily N-acetyltransferase